MKSDKFITFFKKKPNYTMKEIELWLQENHTEFEKYFNNVMNDNMTIFEDKSFHYLPPLCCKRTMSDEFVELYLALKKMSFIFQKENYFEEQILDYNRIKSSKDLTISWVKKNKKIGTKYVVPFQNYMYLDYLKHIDYLQIYQFPSINNRLSIFAPKDDFRYGLEFYKLYNKLYVTDDLLGEQENLLNE